MFILLYPDEHCANSYFFPVDTFTTIEF